MLSRLRFRGLSGFSIVGWRGIAGTGQQGHAFASHFPRHLAQFLGTLVVDRSQLFESSRRAKLGHALKSEFACIAAGMEDVVGGDSKDVFALDDERHEVTFRFWEFGRGLP